MNIRMSSPDFERGLRMLIEQPVLSMIGGLAMAVVIAIGAAYFELAHEIWYPALPLEDGDRLVGIMYRANDDVDPVSVQAFIALREELESIEEIGAYEEVNRQLIVEDGRSGPIEVAWITPSAFPITGARPLLGRTLNAADMREGAPPVAVLGHDVWQARLGGDPDVVGRTLRLGDVTTTVVGVMPEGFAFPENHNVWTPLGLDAANYDRGETPLVTIFGRLAPGYTRGEAREELTAFGSRHAGDFPRTDERKALAIMPFTVAAFEEPMPPGLYLGYPFFAMLMAVVCATVGALMCARTEARRGKVTADAAQDASPVRIMMQSFAAVLLLAVPAAAVGLVAVYVAKPRGTDLFMREFEQPRAYFWWDQGLATGTVLYAAGMAVVGAAFAGVVPASKMIWRRV